VLSILKVTPSQSTVWPCSEIYTRIVVSDVGDGVGGASDGVIVIN